MSVGVTLKVIAEISNAEFPAENFFEISGSGKCPVQSKKTSTVGQSITYGFLISIKVVDNKRVVNTLKTR